MARIVNGVPSRSYVAISQVAGDMKEEMVRVAGQFSKDLVEVMIPRSRDEVSRFFDGLELVEPGLVPVQLWRPDDPEATPDNAQLAPLYAGVARYP